MPSKTVHQGTLLTSSLSSLKSALLILRVEALVTVFFPSQKILNLIKYFRRQWPLFSNSERTTVCGADCMLTALQLSMAEVNKQVSILSVRSWGLVWLKLDLLTKLSVYLFKTVVLVISVLFLIWGLDAARCYKIMIKYFVKSELTERWEKCFKFF